MRVLVLTNHFINFGGSEIVALEVATWFQAQGDSVTLGANCIAAPIAACAEGIDLTEAPEALELIDYDLIWCQHDMLAQLSLAAFERAAAPSRPPFVALVSLSPYEPYEHIDALMARALSAEVLVNSPETRLEVLRRAEVKVAPSRLRVFHNAAPGEFWADANHAPAGPLKTVLLISNHAPAEAIEALAALKQLRRVARANNSPKTSKQAADLLKAFSDYRSSLWQDFPELSPGPEEASVGLTLLNLGRDSEALPVLIREAWALSESAQARLEGVYEQGTPGGMPAFDQRILRYLEQCATEDLPASRVTLARIYFRGLGVPKDDGKVKALLKSLPKAERAGLWESLSSEKPLR